ncbi:reverse transcriptase domain-containing protein [Tanacetum coccineum]|uniref:Reverse transcriptase domain-containing protein n=1 Tax=Tanacetum coccineum TaxID=301880 RepID=A0ABQ4YZ58_9ASTR
MADNRTMAQMLQAPIEGYEDAIEARDWLDKEPPRSILTWDDLVSKFINQYFPPSKTTYYRNEIITFYQKPNEAFNEAWERFKGLLRQCPHHGFSELHQLDTFYNSLNSNDQDALDSAAGGNFLDKMPQEGLAIIESKSKVRYSRSRANDSRVSTDAPLSNSSSSNNSFDMQQIAASLEDKMTIKMNQMMSQMKALVVTPAPVKAVEEVCVTCGSNHNFNHCPLTRNGNDFPVFHDNIQQFQQTAAVADPRVPLILGRPFLRTAHALIDVYEGEITLRNDDQSCRCLHNPSSTLRFQIVLLHPRNTTPFDDSDFLYSLKKPMLFYTIEDKPVSPVFNTTSKIPRFTFSFFRALLNNDPLPSPDQGDYYPGIQKDLKVVEPKESSLEPKDEIPEVELKELPPHLEYAFLEENNKLPVIISKDLSQEEKTSLINVLKNRKQAIAWKLSDIRGIDPEFCSHKILLEDDYQPSVQHQRRVNPRGLKDTTTKIAFYPFKQLKKKLTEAAILIAPKGAQPLKSCAMQTHIPPLKYLFNKKDAKARLLGWVLLLQEFDFKVIDTKGAENYAADHSITESSQVLRLGFIPTFNEATRVPVVVSRSTTDLLILL